MLWEDRVPVTPELIELGGRVWNALREPSPVVLFQVARASEALPQMGVAVTRHLQELPWRGDGLSLTMRLTLGLLAEGPATAASYSSASSTNGSRSSIWATRCTGRSSPSSWAERRRRSPR
jgi:hypothetical protein